MYYTKIDHFDQSIYRGCKMSLDSTPSIFDSQSSLLASAPGDASQDAEMDQIPSESATDTGRGAAFKRNDSDVNDVNEEPEEKDEVQGLGFPTARIQRIMRKHPDKKKRFVKEAVHAVAIATVRRIFCLESFPHPNGSLVHRTFSCRIFANAFMR